MTQRIRDLGEAARLRAKQRELAGRCDHLEARIDRLIALIDKVLSQQEGS